MIPRLLNAIAKHVYVPATKTTSTSCFSSSCWARRAHVSSSIRKLSTSWSVAVSRSVSSGVQRTCALTDRVDLGRRQAGQLGQAHVLRPLVLRARARRDSQRDEFAVAMPERGLFEQDRTEGEERPGERRVVHHRADHVRRRQRVGAGREDARCGARKPHFDGRASSSPHCSTGIGATRGAVISHQPPLTPMIWPVM